MYCKLCDPYIQTLAKVKKLYKIVFGIHTVTENIEKEQIC
jgi:hypothetical protein